MISRVQGYFYCKNDLNEILPSYLKIGLHWHWFLTIRMINYKYEAFMIASFTLKLDEFVILRISSRLTDTQWLVDIIFQDNSKTFNILADFPIFMVLAKNKKLFQLPTSFQTRCLNDPISQDNHHHIRLSILWMSFLLSW